MRDPTQRFTDRVEHYRRFRPSYPEELVRTLATAGMLAPGDHVADVGAGTGLLAELLLDHGNRVIAVEPNGAMREAAERALAGRPGFSSVDGTAEATTLADASVDLVAAGQAFHWFDAVRARREFRRILRPGGRALLVWNDRCDDATPFMRGYEALLREHGTDYRKVDHRRLGETTLAAFFGPAGYERVVLDNRQVLDQQGLIGRVLSCSYVPADGEPGHRDLLAACRALFERCARNGRVVMRYATRAYFGRMS